MIVEHWCEVAEKVCLRPGELVQGAKHISLEGYCGGKTPLDDFCELAIPAINRRAARFLNKDESPILARYNERQIAFFDPRGNTIGTFSDGIDEEFLQKSDFKQTNQGSTSVLLI